MAAEYMIEVMTWLKFKVCGSWCVLIIQNRKPLIV